MRAIFPTHLIIFHLIFQIIPSEEDKLWSSSLCNILQPRGTFSLLRPNIFHSTLFTNFLSLCKDKIAHVLN
jgi:hypothetical protein